MTQTLLKNIIQIRLVELYYETCRYSIDFDSNFMLYVQEQDHKNLISIINSNYTEFLESYSSDELDDVIMKFNFLK